MIDSIIPTDRNRDRLDVSVQGNIPVPRIGNPRRANFWDRVLACYDAVPLRGPQFLQFVLGEGRGFGNMPPGRIVSCCGDHQTGQGQERNGKNAQGHKDLNQCEPSRFFERFQSSPPFGTGYSGIKQKPYQEDSGIKVS